MSATIGEILERLGLMDDEEPMQKEASRSIEEDLSAMIDEVFGLTKVANPTIPTKTPEEEEAAKQEVAQQVQESEPQLTQQDIENIEQAQQAMEQSAAAATEEAKATLKENIIQAGVSLVEEAAGELLEQQREKIAAVQELFGEGSAKGKLFAKLAADHLISVGRIVRDYDFSSHQGGIFSPDEYVDNAEGEPVNTL